MLSVLSLPETIQRPTLSFVFFFWRQRRPTSPSPLCRKLAWCPMLSAFRFSCNHQCPTMSTRNLIANQCYPMLSIILHYKTFNAPLCLCELSSKQTVPHSEQDIVFKNQSTPHIVSLLLFSYDGTLHFVHTLAFCDVKVPHRVQKKLEN